MKALITGSTGFVGPYLRKELEQHGYTVQGIGLNPAHAGDRAVDITAYPQVLEAVRACKPDVVYHLAGFSSIAASFKQPELCRRINVEGTKNLLDAIIEAKIRPTILIVSSCDIYGESRYIPIDETHPLQPISPYAQSRIEQEQLSLSYALPVIIARSFNHTGPDQPPIFVIPSLVQQIAQAQQKDRILVGNLDVIRDFSHAKDIAAAYRILTEKGAAGEIYNVGSGIGCRLQDILEALIADSGKDIEVVVDPERYRPADNRVSICDATKAKALGIAIPSYFKERIRNLYP